MLYQIYSVVINKCRRENKSEDKMEKQINEKIREIAQSVNEEGKNEYIYNLYIPKQYNFPNNTEIIDIEKIIEQIKGNLPNQGVILND